MLTQTEKEFLLGVLNDALQVLRRKQYLNTTGIPESTTELNLRRSDLPQALELVLRQPAVAEDIEQAHEEQLLRLRAEKFMEHLFKEALVKGTVYYSIHPVRE